MSRATISVGNRAGELQHLLHAAEKIVLHVGRGVLAYEGEVIDTEVKLGHEESIIDYHARQLTQEWLDRELPDLQGVIRFELRPFKRQFIGHDGGSHYVLIIDEIEGTTNTKRALASRLRRRPEAGVSLAISLNEALSGLVVSAFYAMHSDTTYSAILMGDDGGERSFMAFHDGQHINPSKVIHRLGDSRDRIMVIGYSNSHRLKKGELEQALWDAGFKVYEGCRASGVDILNIIRNGYDAYVDLRACWSTLDENGVEKEAQLQVYDGAGILPIALGCGLKVADPTGGSWEDYGILDAMPIVVSRPGIHDRIMKVVAPFAQKWKGEALDLRRRFDASRTAPSRPAKREKKGA